MVKIVEPSVKVLSKLDGNEALMMIQRCAKTCYKSYKDEDDIESAKRIVKMLLDSGHHSMLENYSITMNYISNVAAYKDLTRMRLCSFSVESTRYVNFSKDKFGNEINVLKPVELDENSDEYIVWKNTMEEIERGYMEMARLGCKPDQLSLVLGHSTAAEFNITANLREWRHVLDLRACNSTGHVRPCILEIMQPTLEIFHKEIPVIFDDLYEKYLKIKNN